MGKFTASKIHALTTRDRSLKGLGKTAKTYIHECVSELITGQVRTLDMWSLDWGLQNEPLAAAAIKKLLPGFEHFGDNNPKFFQWDRFSGGSPDGVDWTGEPKKVFEIKCPENFAIHVSYCLIDTQDALKLEKPDYYGQIQFNMLCASKHYGCRLEEIEGVFASYCPEIQEGFRDLHLVPVLPDKDYLQGLLNCMEEAKKYYEEVYLKLQKNGTEYQSTSDTYDTNYQH